MIDEFILGGHTFARCHSCCSRKKSLLNACHDEVHVIYNVTFRLRYSVHVCARAHVHASHHLTTLY